MHDTLDLNCWLGKRNPTIKFFLLIFMTFSVSFTFDALRMFILWILALSAFYCSTRFRLIQIIKLQKPFLWISLVIFMVNCISRPGQIIVNFLFFDVTDEGIYIGVALALRTLFIGMLSTAFIKTTCPNKLMLSLHKHGKLSIKVSYAIMTGFYIVQRLSYDWHMILAAHRTRIGTKEVKSLKYDIIYFYRQLMLYKTSLLGLLVSAIRLCERIAFILETKGLGLTPRTQLNPVTLIKTDYLFGGITIIILFLILWI